MRNLLQERRRDYYYRLPRKLRAEVWHRADMGVSRATGVSAWANLGTLKGTLAQGTGANQPAYAAIDTDFVSKAALAFDDTNDQLVSSLSITTWKFLHDGSGCTSFDVFRPTGGGVLDETDQSLQATNANMYSTWNFNVGNAHFWQVDNTSGTPLFTAATTASIPSGTRVQTCRRMATGASPQFSFRRNGVQDASGSFTGSPSASDPVNTLRLGGASTGLPIGMKIAELVRYKRYLTNTEVFQHGVYFRARYQLP